MRPQSTFSFVLFVGDKPWYFLFIDKKNRKAYRGFEARLDPVTAKVVPWGDDEEPIDAMEVATVLEHVEEVAPAASTTTTEAVTATAEELLLQQAGGEGEGEGEGGPVSAADRKQNARIRKKAGTREQLLVVIDKHLEPDKSCDTAVKCFSNTDFKEQIKAYLFQLKHPFNIPHATPVLFDRLFRQRFPKERHPYKSGFYKYVKFTSPDFSFDEEDENGDQVWYS